MPKKRFVSLIIEIQHDRCQADSETDDNTKDKDKKSRIQAT